MPILGRQAQHHYAKYNEETTKEKHGPKVAEIKERPRQYSNEDEQPALDGSNPTDR